MKTEYELTQPFERIVCSDYGSVILTQADEPSLVIEGDEERLTSLSVETRNGTLYLGVQKDWLNQFGKFFSSMFQEKNLKVVYYLSVPNLNKIAISGKIDLSCQSFTADELNLSVSGYGDSHFNHLVCNQLEVQVSGRAKFKATGRADEQIINISGSGDYSADSLLSMNSKVTISGQGDVTLNVSESLDVKISGVGRVNYYGRPKLRQVISGVGRSKRLNDI